MPKITIIDKEVKRAFNPIAHNILDLVDGQVATVNAKTGAVTGLNGSDDDDVEGDSGAPGAASAAAARQYPALPISSLSFSSLLSLAPASNFPPALALLHQRSPEISTPSALAPKQQDHSATYATSLHRAPPSFTSSQRLKQLIFSLRRAVSASCLSAVRGVDVPKLNSALSLVTTAEYKRAMVNRDGSPVLNFKMSSSKSQDGEQTMPVYHSNHSYLFTKVIERHPNLTKDELEKEFKSNVEGAYVTELLDDLEQGRDLIAKFQAMISKLKEELAIEKQKVEDADCFGKFTQQYVSQALQETVELRGEKQRLEEEHAAVKKKLESKHKAECQDYSTQIEKLRAEKKRLMADDAEVKRLNKDLKEKRDVQVRKFEVLLAEKTDLEKKVKTKDEEVEDLEDEVAMLQQDNAELEKALTAHKDRIMSLEEGISLYDQVLRDRARQGQYGNQDGSDL
ncbi:hypothetical protein SMACR_01532 [Sordaria macrospora]|uniref:WGS project CABT00000000 data, contig 2.4 n=2 Tax=Sordaria macrospora TaxID=5147 RepID=F7VR36_SORMK|nr:uncharacterized protein SMAC_01532 [Sordaria macrospora k-hell]KAA8635360.1 hypothetical protein SMACR_01532 [Sordaria macrospora]WPJ58577.1 hypothetical protein SMAC4_01532 [Sordaria macrospora]CCC07969.1 unnamed protein product [Sordaria macrospora k-hell]